MNPQDGLLLLIVVALGYVIYRLNRLEQLFTGGAKRRRSGGDPKVIPILKDNIPQGPFKGPQGDK